VSGAVGDLVEERFVIPLRRVETGDGRHIDFIRDGGVKGAVEILAVNFGHCLQAGDKVVTRFDGSSVRLLSV